MSGTEPAGGSAARRVLGGVLLTGAALITFGFFGGGTAWADVTVQDSDVDNAGVGVANSGGNAAVGNVTDDQTAVNAQGAASGGGIAANQGSAKNKSTGSATIVTGSASATGNQSSTGVNQGAASAGGGGGIGNVTVQDADVNNAGAGIANSGGNVAVGNVVGNQVAVNAQGALALGGIATNIGGASNEANGAATIVTGPATAVGNQSVTGIDQSALSLGAFGGVGGITVQDANVNNLGVGVANSGLNAAVGNITPLQVAVNAQGALALGGLAANLGGASNVSNGAATIVTGPATAVGNQSWTGVSQSAATLGGGLFPGVTLQGINVNNFGVGIANTGLNGAVGNVTGPQVAVNLQGALALFGLAVNGGPGAFNVSNGSATTVTGSGTAVGNSSSTVTSQHSLAMATAPAAAGVSGAWLWLLLSGLVVATRRR
jgi:hypothetical protein